MVTCWCARVLRMSEPQLLPDVISLRRLLLLGLVLHVDRLQVLPVLAMLTLELEEVLQMLGRELAELELLLLENLLELIDLELAELRDSLNDPPLLIAGERNGAAQQC